MATIIKNNGVKAPNATSAILRAQAAQIRASRKGLLTNLYIHPNVKVVELTIHFDTFITELKEHTYTTKEITSRFYYNYLKQRIEPLRTIVLTYKY